MEYNIVKYQKKHFKQCVNLISDTWNFNKHFPDRKKENLINELYFRLSIIDFDYSEIVVDKNDNVCGYIFGKVKKDLTSVLNTFFKVISAIFICSYHYLIGNMGKYSTINQTIKSLLDATKKLESKLSKKDAYASLFFVGSSLRGTGLGKKLMSRFIDSASKYNLNRVYLYTDKGCNYGYYDHTGFTRILEISSPILDGYGDEPNGFAYVKPLS